MNTPRTDFVAHESGDIEWNRFPNRFARMKAHAEIMERENAALLEQERDAKRYQWLRERHENTIMDIYNSISPAMISPELFDAAIDSAMEKNT